jgi:hypothetical protein
LFDNNNLSRDRLKLLFYDNGVFEMNRSLIALLLAAALVATPAIAAPSTKTGQISAAQVFELIDQAPNDKASRNALIAYLAGLGETAGILMAEAKVRTSAAILCERDLGIGDQVAAKALRKALPDRASWPEAAATPIILADMLQRAGCK